MNWTVIAAATVAMAWGAPAFAANVKLRVGTSGASSDVAFFIADKKGYFKQEGLDVEFTPFDSAAKMVAPLGVGQLEVGGGSVSVGFYNAVARGVDIKIVADKGSTPAGHGFQPLLVRKDLVDSGRYKSLQDLKGMKVAGSAPGSGSTATLNEALKKGGLAWDDVQHVYMGFSEQVLALQNKAIDASLTTEPNATGAVKEGAAVRVMGDDQIYPNHQLSVVLYSGAFIKSKPDAAKRFMVAYLKAVRDYNNALDTDGKLAGSRADEVVSILTQYTEIKDPALFRAIVVQGVNRNGYVNEASLKSDLAFFKSSGDVTGAVSVEQSVDNSFVDAALKELGGG